MKIILKLCKELYLKLFRADELRAIDYLNKNIKDNSYTLQNLYNLALDIYKLKLTSNYYYYPQSFSTMTGGFPVIEANLNIPIEITTCTKLTTSTGLGSAVVKCRPLGIKDLDGSDIYEASNGVLFIYLYKPIDATGYDLGKFTFPRIELEKIKDSTLIFRDTARYLISQLVTKYPMEEGDQLALENRLTDMQLYAYAQTVTSKEVFESKLDSISTSES